MKTSQKVFILFLLLGGLFIAGSLFDLRLVTLISNYLIIPVLILYYRYKSKKWFIAMVIALLLFYVRDTLLLYGFPNYPNLIMISFGCALSIVYMFAIVGFQRSKIHFVELISVLIMYGFLGFLFFSIGELVPQVMPSYKGPTYLYLFLLTFLLAITFTSYLLKSHYASLWLMLASASLLVSELSLFFKMYIVSDFSVNVFYPLFHVIAYYALVEHAINRRRSQRIPFF
ncbi:hypothetical protein [Salinimicrobium soli]|uniref:hypothetical protein n=1 Tax=Salinimicrobium soli TaxID=1254399 RepID=UPI003AADC999